MKRIITCSDGTWNKPNTKDKDGKAIKTNVQRIFDCIEKRDKGNDRIQIKYYDEGIGAQGNALIRMFNGATGEGIDDNIKDVYKFICWNYEPGDDIFLFGFSRGAYTARSLAGLIRKCGIIKKNDLDLINDAYELYRDKEHGPTSALASDFRKDNSYDVASIKFIGVWDTVGSLGLPLHSFQWFDKRRYTFYDTTLSSIIEHAYHAMAVDEKRKTFEPTLWQKSNNQQPGFVQTLEQRWFPGVHSNVGGGYPDSSLSNIALKWLFKKAGEAGLCIDPGYKNLPDNYTGTIYNPLKGVFSLLPKKDRVIVTDNITSFVDESVYKRMALMDGKYKPVNVPREHSERYQLETGRQIQITIRADEAFSSDALLTQPGERYRIWCDANQKWTDSTKRSSPQGFFNFPAWLIGLRVKGVKCFCLCAAYNGDDATAFPVFTPESGIDRTIETGKNSGVLSFFPNDAPNHYRNNKGSIQINIMRLA